MGKPNPALTLAVVVRLAVAVAVVSPWETAVTVAVSVVPFDASSGMLTLTVISWLVPAASGPTVVGAIVVVHAAPLTLRSK